MTDWGVDVLNEDTGTWEPATCAQRDAAIAAAGGYPGALHPRSWRTDGQTYSHSELWSVDGPVVADHRTVKRGCWHEVWTA